jgi:HPt (histidine-containing phosphotransfer) domain-containing protein
VYSQPSHGPDAPRPTQAPGEVKGLNLTKALGGLSGNWAVLLKLLAGFRDSFGGSLEDIRTALEAGDPGLAAGKLHTLKGVAGMLSASRLHEAAQRLEQELALGTPHEGWPEFQDAFEELLAGIAGVQQPNIPSGGVGHGQDSCR